MYGAVFEASFAKLEKKLRNSLLKPLNEMDRDNGMRSRTMLIHKCCCDRSIIGALINFFLNLIKRFNCMFF